uniref:Uncharacterized protein n=1 Tax=Romanomermis culicivorax TaxID=13658 RepID=A0A915I817_ROMCU
MIAVVGETSRKIVAFLFDGSPAAIGAERGGDRRGASTLPAKFEFRRSTYSAGAAGIVKLGDSIREQVRRERRQSTLSKVWSMENLNWRKNRLFVANQDILTSPNSKTCSKYLRKADSLRAYNPAPPTF